MNQRIRELAEQAEKLKRDEVSYRERLRNKYCTGDMEEEIFREKFAELIVRECLEQIYSVTIDNPTDDWDQGYDSGLNQAAETIKTHFGVEE
jgi:hypothetical protein